MFTCRHVSSTVPSAHPIASRTPSGANATHAAPARMPPIQIHVGRGEVLVAENAIFATRMAASGGAVELHEYDAMWHVFPMYYEGCEHPRHVPLLFAHSALTLTRTFLTRLAGHAHLAWHPNGVPYTLTHYEFPRGVDTAMNVYEEMDAAA